jgi:nucleoid-associated protein
MAIVHRIIIHSISKVKGQEGAPDPILSTTLHPIDEISIHLVDVLDASYKNTGMTHAMIDQASTRIFPTQFFQYYAQQTEQKFIEFSQESVRDLNDSIRGNNLATGGYLVITDYSISGIHFVSVFLIRDTNSIHFSRNQDQTGFIIQEIEHLNLDKLAMACRINLTLFENHPETRYLGLIAKNAEDISLYFQLWVGRKDPKNNAISTNELYDLVEKVPEFPDIDGNIVTNIDFKKRVSEYIKENPQKEVDLLEMGNHFFNDPEYFRRLAAENDIHIDDVFQADRRALRRFERVSLNMGGIVLQFNRAELDHTVEAVDNTVIIRSAALAAEVRRQRMHNAGN